MTRFGVLAVPDVTGPLCLPPLGTRWYYRDASHTYAWCEVVGVREGRVQLRGEILTFHTGADMLGYGRREKLAPFWVDADWFRSHLVRLARQVHA